LPQCLESRWVRLIRYATEISFLIMIKQTMCRIWTRLMKLYDAMAKWVLDSILVNGKNENDKKKA
jgi:hypothetical protein